MRVILTTDEPDDVPLRSPSLELGQSRQQPQGPTITSPTP